ncbi:Protein of unknown function [Gryllus bimaculatus]|nr:Protein of unknown function [Gryllus bimaculatus]
MLDIIGFLYEVVSVMDLTSYVLVSRMGWCSERKGGEIAGPESSHWGHRCGVAPRHASPRPSPTPFRDLSGGCACNKFPTAEVRPPNALTVPWRAWAREGRGDGEGGSESAAAVEAESAASLVESADSRSRFKSRNAGGDGAGDEGVWARASQLQQQQNAASKGSNYASEHGAIPSKDP